MWRTGFTLKVRTPHLKFGSWNDSRVSTVFLVWIKPNILWIRLRPALRNVNFDWGRCELFCVGSAVYEGSKMNDKTSLQTRFFFSGLPISAEQRSFTSDRSTRFCSLVGFLYCVWFGSVFGFSRLFIFGFLCVVFFFLCQDSLFLYLIKIWKLNFHSIFSNHLIKISSTTTKKIRSSCSNK